MPTRRPAPASTALPAAQLKLDAAFDFFQRLGMPYWCFHDRDVAPEGATLRESNAHLDAVLERAAKKMQDCGIEESDSAGLQSRFEGEGEHMVGGGVATFDCDGDGLPEVYVTAGVKKARFYRNRSARGGPIKLVEERPNSGAKPASAYSANVATEGFQFALLLTQQTPGFSPPVASRALGYLGLALYESVLPGMPANLSLAGQLNELSSLPWAQPDEPLHWPTAANAAMATITRMMFPTASAFVDNTHNDRGWGPRSFKSFQAAADEAALSRLYAGIHFRSSVEAGQVQRLCVAKKVLALKLRR